MYRPSGLHEPVSSAPPPLPTGPEADGAAESDDEIEERVVVNSVVVGVVAGGGDWVEDPGVMKPVGIEATAVLEEEEEEEEGRVETTICDDDDVAAGEETAFEDGDTVMKVLPV